MDEGEEDEYVILQCTEPNRYHVETGATRTGLDELLDASELCCLCYLCLQRNPSGAESIVDGLSLSGSSPATHGDGFIFKDPGEPI